MECHQHQPPSLREVAARHHPAPGSEWRTSYSIKEGILGILWITTTTTQSQVGAMSGRTAPQCLYCIRIKSKRDYSPCRRRRCSTTYDRTALSAVIISVQCFTSSEVHSCLFVFSKKIICCVVESFNMNTWISIMHQKDWMLGRPLQRARLSPWQRIGFDSDPPLFAACLSLSLSFSLSLPLFLSTSSC